MVVSWMGFVDMLGHNAIKIHGQSFGMIISFGFYDS